MPSGRAALGAARVRAFAHVPQMMAASEGLSIVDGFRAAVASLRAEHGSSHEATIVGALPVIVGALVRRAKGEAAVAPDATLSHAMDTLRMLHGRAVSAAGDPGLYRLVLLAIPGQGTRRHGIPLTQ